MPASVTLSRTSEKDIKMRDLYVTLDGGEERNVLFGRSTTFEVPPGEHTIQVTNRLYTKTETFGVDDGQEVRFLASNIWAGGCIMWFVVFISGAYKVTLERV